MNTMKDVVVSWHKNDVSAKVSVKSQWASTV